MKKIIIPLAITSLLIIAVYLLFGDIEIFFTNWLEQVKNNSLKYASLSFIILVSDIVLPVPSSIVMYANGIVLGAINGFLISMASVICSSVIGYYLGRSSSNLFKSKTDVSVADFLEKYGYAAILMTRGIPILSETVCIVCGYDRYNFRNFLLLSVIGYSPICFIYAYFGSISVNQNLFLICFGCSLIVTFLLWITGKKIFRGKFN